MDKLDMRRGVFWLAAAAYLAAASTATAQPPPSQPATAAPSVSNTSADENGITLNFVNADVRDVVKAVLGDYLKLNYEIGSNVQGTVTLQTSQPLSREHVLPALEQALALNNLALVHANGIYEVMPLTDAHKQAGMTPGHFNGGPLGYGTEVVHVRYLGAEQMQKLVAPLAAAEGAIRVDPSSNTLLIEGTAQERRAILQDIALFDVDSMAHMSFELFQPEHMDADELSKELTALMGGVSGQASGGARLVPIDRLNAVLAITPQPRFLNQLRVWVARLDKPGQGNDKKIFVYHVQNGRATDLANTLLKTLFGSAAGTTTTTPSPSPFSSQSGGSMSGSTNNFGSGSLLGGGTTLTQGGTTPSHPTSGSAAFQPVTTPEAEHEGRARNNFETVGGVSREGINSVNITADENNNALVILATPREYNVIQDALRQLDVAPVQVLLEAAIAEVTLTKEIQFGVQFFLQNAHNQGVLTQGSSVPLPPPTTTTDTGTIVGQGGIPTTTTPTVNISAPYPGFSYMYSNGANIQVILNALDSVTHVEVISSPQVMVLNNQLASLEVGDQVPILSGEAQSTVTADSPVVNSVEYLDTGVILRVTPRVNRSGQVMMDISQEVSGVDNSASSVSTIGSPTIQQRKIESSVSIGDGETVALGGLFSDQVSTSRNGIPWLDRIPVLGYLFGATDNSHNRTELMVLITPHVVESPEKARAVTDELRRELPEVQPLFDQGG
jgi:general secretion pathway protein D